MRNTIAKMLRRAVRAEPMPLQMEYAQHHGVFGDIQALPLTARYPAASARAEYKALKRLYRATPK